MKKKMIALFLVICIVSSISIPTFAEYSSFELSWSKNYGGIASDSATAIQPTSDGGTIVTGYVNSDVVEVGFTDAYRGGNDLWVAKLNDAGDVVWSRTLGGSLDDSGVSVQVIGNECVVAANSLSADHDFTGNYGSYDVWIIRFDELGNVIQSKQFGGTGDDRVTDLQCVLSGGFIFSGYSQINGPADYWIVKLDANMDTVWDKHYGGSGVDIANGIAQTADQGFIIAGSTTSTDNDETIHNLNGYSDAWILKIDEFGTKKWSQYFGDANSDNVTRVIVDSDDNCLFTGTKSYNYNYNYWVVKLSSNGSTIWDRVYSSYYGSSNSIIQMNDGSYFVAGTSQTIRIDQYGDILQTFAHTSYGTTVNAIAKNLDGSLMCAGSATSTIPDHYGSIDIYVARIGFPENIGFADLDLRQLLIDNGFDKNTDNEISKVEALALQYLSVYGDYQNSRVIDDLHGLEYALNLSYLSLSSYAGNDISPLSSLQGLRTLNLSDCNNITNLNALSNLVDLSNLNIRSCVNLSDFSSLQNLSNVTTLSINECWQLVDLDFMPGMTHLQSASLNYNSIRDITGIQNLSALNSLKLSHNQVTSISPVLNLTNLSNLDLQYNNVTDITVFAYMNNPHMQVLNLSSNPIDDLTPLLELSALSELMIYADPEVLNTSTGSDNMQIIRELVNRSVNVFFTSVNYQTYIQDIGLQSIRFNGETAGYPALAKPIKGFSANLILEGTDNNAGKIEYKADFRDYGWTYWTSDTILGAPNDVIEGMAFRLPAYLDFKYDLYYRVYIENFKWLDWAINGQEAGSYGYGYPIIAVEIQLATKGSVPPGATDTPYMVNPNIVYHTVQFSGLGDSIINPIQVETNTKLLVPDQPIRDGYTFDGWYRELSYLSQWNFDTDFVTSDMTLYAKWVTDTTNNILIKTYPSKLIYAYGDLLDLGGGVITVLDEVGNATDMVMTASDVSVTGYDGTILGTQVLTITYMGMSTQYSVEVLPHQSQAVTEIYVKGFNNANTVALNGTLQIVADVQPIYATNKAIAWSVRKGTGTATISTTGLLTGTKAGAVTVTATATDGSGVKASVGIIVMVPIASINVSSENSVSTVEVMKTLQMTAAILPVNATYKSLIWSVQPGTGTASITSTGLLSGVTEGTVTVVASANDGTGVLGSTVVTVIPERQIIPITHITVSSSTGSIVLKIKASIQMIALIQPQEATIKDVSWRLVFGNGQARISETGVLTGTRAGTVTVIATAKDGSAIEGSKLITIYK